MSPVVFTPNHPSFVPELEAMDAMISPARMGRRRFLAAAAALPLAWPRMSRAAAADKSSNRSTVVDTHVHCFAGKNDARFPYHSRAPYRPDAPATPQHLLQCMNEAGVDYAVIVHPEPYQDDHHYLEYCFEIGQARFKGTCLFFADRPASLAQMPGLVKRLPIVAARIHAYAPNRLPPFGKPALRELWKVAGTHGLAVQLHFEPRYAPGFEPLIKEFSEVKVVLDHLGRPFQGTPDEHEVVMRWARFPNTIVKLSAIPSSTSYPHRDIAPVIKRLAQEFGPDRLIYGGGFSAEATGTSYRAAREQARSYIAFFSAADQAKVLGENAARLFGFKRS